MIKLQKSLAVGVMSIAMGLTSIIPAHAITFPKVPVPSVSDVENVQYSRRDKLWQERRVQRQRNWRGNREWRGHRGYRHQRPGYRRHSDGWWYPLAAFGIGSVIGGAIANQPAAGGNSHVNWCANRYRSYRAYDNTFQPYNGPRQQCHSPYSR